MKDLLTGIFIVLSILLFIPKSFSQNNEIGYWLNDENNLPCFNYTGKIPFTVTIPNGEKAKLPDDPWFLLGNYQLTLFAHVSGTYELITGQRAWGRMNQGDTPNSGINQASLEIIGQQDKKEKILLLTGMNSLSADPVRCDRVFGCGFARYSYHSDSIAIDRVLSVKPSTNPYNGTSAFLLTIKIKNESHKKRKLAYNESITAHYQTMQQQHENAEKQKVKYTNTLSADITNQQIIADIHGVTRDPLLFTSKEDISMYEGFPPSLFLKSLSKDINLFNIPKGDRDELTARCEFILSAGEEKNLELIIGYTFENETSSINQICDELSQKHINSCREKKTFCSGAAYGNDWLKVLPAFNNENNVPLRQELIWHAYNLEAMATYSEFYKETKIPQGTIYDYDWGMHASARDNFQHALPLVYYNPQLAKSVLRYMLKRTTACGEIRLVEMGNGYANNSSYFTSDQQLFFFMLLAEYLKVTHDYAFLKEEIEYYPVINQSKASVAEFTKQCFRFLRDEIGTGEHGLVRLMNSDWNDAVFYIVDAPYNKVVFSGESHMNSAMALVVFQKLIPELKSAENSPELASKKSLLENLSKSMEIYRNSILKAYLADWDGRAFPRRMYFNGNAYGEDNMFLEPQGYTLLIDEIAVEKKKNLYQEMKRRVYAGEKLGAREQQMPEFEDESFDKGSRENGGFWWALNGPVINGIAQWDKTEAMRLLKNMTFTHFAEAFPHYWTSYWSAADNIESSLIPGEGLPDQTYNYSDIPVFCAHPHAWILYCYYTIHQNE